MNPREVLEFAKKNKVQIVDLKFVDLLGTWQHFSIPVEELNEGVFKDGSGLDGSSIRGFTSKGIMLSSIKDATPVAFNGPKAPRARRV